MKQTHGIVAAFGLMLALALGGCGFEPMYGPRTAGGTAAADLSAVDLAPIRDTEGLPYRLGLDMANALRERLYPSGVTATRYRLEMVIDRDLQGFGYRADEAVTRFGLRLTAHYRLVDTASEAVLLEETARVFNSFDVVQSDFATLIAERDMEQRLVRELSERITGRLGLYFRDREAEPGADAAT